MRSEREIREVCNFLEKVVKTHDASLFYQVVCVDCRKIIHDERLESWYEPPKWIMKDERRRRAYEESMKLLAELPKDLDEKKHEDHEKLSADVEFDAIYLWYACLKWVLGEDEK